MGYKQTGVTLVELMIVMVVIAILGSIALPSYRNYVLRSSRTEATTALLRIQTAQEKAFLQNNVYATALAGGPPAGLNMAATSATGKYDLQLLAGLVPGGYVAQAAPAPGTGQDEDADCATLTIDQNGTRGATGAAADPILTCWR